MLVTEAVVGFPFGQGGKLPGALKYLYLVES